MSAALSFTLFHALPPELRLRIWGLALSVPSVWAAIPNSSVDHYLRASCLIFTMVYIGPAPYLAGLSCWEARRLLEQTYVRPLRGPCRSLATNTGSHWVNLDTTVIYLGDAWDAISVLNSFEADELSRFKHVALLWYQFGSIVRACQRLATMCPALCTIIVQRGETNVVTGQPIRQHLSVKTAAYYAALPEHASADLRYEELDTSYFRSLILEYFGDSPLKFHLLPPDSINRAPQF